MYQCLKPCNMTLESSNDYANETKLISIMDSVLALRSKKHSCITKLSVQFLMQPGVREGGVRPWKVFSGRSHPGCCVLPQDLSLWRRRRESPHHTLPLHGHPALCPPVLPPPVDQELRHALLWALQVRLHHGDQAQTPPEGTVSVGTGLEGRTCKAGLF